MIGYGSVVGDGNFFLAQSVLGHYSILGNHNALAGRACIGGDCVIGDQNYLGLNTTIFNEVHIGCKNIVGGGSVLKSDITDFTIVSATESKVKKTNEKTVEFAVSAETIKGIK